MKGNADIVIELLNGILQGDPLSALIFIMAISPLSCP